MPPAWWAPTCWRPAGAGRRRWRVLRGAAGHAADAGPGGAAAGGGATGLAGGGGQYMTALADSFYTMIKTQVLDKGAQRVVVINMPGITNSASLPDRARRHCRSQWWWRDRCCRAGAERSALQGLGAGFQRAAGDAVQGPCASGGGRRFHFVRRPDRLAGEVRPEQREDTGLPDHRHRQPRAAGLYLPDLLRRRVVGCAAGGVARGCRLVGDLPSPTVSTPRPTVTSCWRSRSRAR